MSEDKRPAYQWYPKDFSADEHVRLMSYEQEGIYRALLDHAWLNGSIPADIPSIARLLSKGVTAKRLDRLWPGLAPCWVERDGRLVNGRQERDRTEHELFRAERAISGSRGAAKRWNGNGSANGSAISSATAGAMAQPMANDSSASASASPSAKAKPRQRRVADEHNWLVPYLNAYRQHVGDPPAARIAGALKPVEDAIGPDRLLPLWVRWCQSDKTAFGPQWFAANWKKADRPATGKPSQLDRNLAAIASVED